MGEGGTKAGGRPHSRDEVRKCGRLDNQVMEVKLIDGNLHLSRFDLRNIDKIIDQGEQMLAGAQNNGKFFLLFLIQGAEPLLLDDRGKADD